MSLKLIKIGDLGEVITGNTPPKKDPENYGGDYPFIKPTDMDIDKKYVTEWDETYSEKAYNKYHRAYIPPGATGVVTIGTVGEKLFQAHQHCFTNQSVNVIIPNDNYYDDYVFYLMKLNLPKVENANPGTASGRHHVSKSNFCSIKVDVIECLNSQKRIADILSAYDDLIENNLKRIKLLEQAAQNIYKEWFVNLRFPGNENTPINEETGLPEGWKNLKFGSVFNVQNGYAFKSKDYREKGVPILRTRDYSSSFFINISDPIFLPKEFSDSHKKYFVKELDFLLIMVGASIGKNGLVLKKDLPALQNQNQWAIRVKGEYSSYEYFKIYCVKSIIDSLLMKRTGAARDFFRASFIKEIDVQIPNENVVKEFTKNIKPCIEQINLLLTQNQKLKSARDILLPRLMNRTIEV